MGTAQDQLLKFVLDRVQGDKKEETQQLLSGQLEQHSNGSLDISSLAALAPQLAKMATPEHMEEISGLVKGLGSHPDQLSGLMSLLGGLGGKDGEKTAAGNHTPGSPSAMDEVKGLLSLFAK